MVGCRALLGHTLMHCPQRMQRPRKPSSAKEIRGLIHVIDQEMCIKCGSCFDACPEKFDAISVLTGEQPVPPSIPEDERVVVRKGKGAG
jgi:NAD-dependent dihydropyrimidine dehydrogenase PreA subunit